MPALKKSPVKRIAVLTSGGDAPGMNAAIRSVVRSACAFGLEVIGVERGFHGLIHQQFRPMGPRSVSGIIYEGGTILRTARSEEFLSVEGRAKAAENVRSAGIDGIVAIGGDGTYRGAVAFEFQPQYARFVPKSDTWQPVGPQGMR